MNKYIAILLLVIPMLAFAESHSVTEPKASIQMLLTKCKSQISFEKGYCSGFIAASMGPTFRRSADGIWRVVNCLPPSLTVEQVQRLFIDYANGHPEKWHESAESGVRESLAEKFPCKE